MEGSSSAAGFVFFRMQGTVAEVADQTMTPAVAGIEMVLGRQSVSVVERTDTMQGEEYSGNKAPGSNWARLSCRRGKDADSEGFHIAVDRMDWIVDMGLAGWEEDSDHRVRCWGMHFLVHTELTTFAQGVVD
jgi:hypothetical protein